MQERGEDGLTCLKWRQSVNTSAKLTSGSGPVAIEIEYQEAHHYTRAFLTHIVLATNLLVVFNGVLFAGIAPLGDTLLSSYQGADPRVLGLLRSIAWGHPDHRGGRDQRRLRPGPRNPPAEA